MNSSNNPKVGTLVISDDVIAKIAGTAALDIAGVDSLVARPGDIKGFMKRGRDLKAVRVSGENETAVDLHLKLKKGARIPEVTEEVQRAVKENVQNMTGRAVSRVNVHIEDIELKKE